MLKIGPRAQGQFQRRRAHERTSWCERASFRTRGPRTQIERGRYEWAVRRTSRVLMTVYRKPSRLPTIESGAVMGRKVAIFIRIMCVSILLIGSSVSYAAPDAVPKLNTKLTCESHGRKSITHGNSNLSIEACKRSENHAHEIMIKGWSKYANSDKMDCHGMVTQGGPPSYVELHSCLESRKHAREIRKAHHKDNLKMTSAKRTSHQ